LQNVANVLPDSFLTSGRHWLYFLDNQICQRRKRELPRYSIVGWDRETVQLGLNEHRTGVICQGAQAACSGDKLWEEKHPEVAQALWALVELHSQQDPTFRTLLSYTRLTVAEALKQLRAQGFHEDQLPSPSTMTEVLNRNGYRLRKVLKAKPQDWNVTRSYPNGTS
jgi:hypothetical protein